MTRWRASKIVIVASVLVAGTGAGYGGYALTSAGLDQPETATAPSYTTAPTPSAVASALLAPPTTSASDPPMPTAAAVTAALTGPLAAAALGGNLLAQVSDAVTGTVLFTKSAVTTTAPASTAKIATAAAVLATHAPNERITTTVVAGSTTGQVVLVGGGDPTLSGAAPGTATTYAGAARISDLAAQLKGTTVTQIVVDGGLFPGPNTAPGWLKNDVPTDYASTITALMADGGRDNPTAPIRSANPDLAAGIELAADLGLPAGKVIRGSAPATAKQLAAVQSATFGELVEQMLQQSDNVIAECLARQVAIANHQPAGFTGAVTAIRATLTTLGVDIGAGLTDGSGLAPTDRISPAALVGLLRLATQNAQLRPLIDDLPVAGWDGTLDTRYQTGPAAGAAGLVRAKTGTLTSVSTLAGVVTTAKGRVLVFAFMADKVGPTAAATTAAEAALDVAAAALVAL